MEVLNPLKNQIEIAIKFLRKDKFPVIFTVINIILISCLMVGGFTLKNAFNRFIKEDTIEKNGSWVVKVSELSDEVRLTMKEKISQVKFYEEEALSIYASTNPLTQDKIMIKGLSGFQPFPIHLISGRLPKTAQEIIIPTGISQDDKLVLQKKYKIVGIAQQNDFFYSNNVFHAFTLQDNRSSQTYIGIANLNKQKWQTLNNILENELEDCVYNTSYVSTFSFFQKTPVLLLIGIIFVVFVIMLIGYLFMKVSLNLLIFNKSKDIKVLSMIGMKRSEINKVVIYEILFIIVLTVPFAILFSIGIWSGILKYISPMIQTIVNTKAVLSIHLSFTDILFVILFIHFILILNLYLVFIRLKKNTNKRTDKQKIVKRSYALEERNLGMRFSKADHYQHKTAFLSLTLSFTLLLSCGYTLRNMTSYLSILRNNKYDFLISYMESENNLDLKNTKIVEDISILNKKGTTRSHSILSLQGKIDESSLSKEAIVFEKQLIKNHDNFTIPINLHIVNDLDFIEYSKNNGIHNPDLLKGMDFNVSKDFNVSFDSVLNNQRNQIKVKNLEDEKHSFSMDIQGTWENIFSINEKRNNEFFSYDFLVSKSLYKQLYKQYFSKMNQDERTIQMIVHMKSYHHEKMKQKLNQYKKQYHPSLYISDTIEASKQVDHFATLITTLSCVFIAFIIFISLLNLLNVIISNLYHRSKEKVLLFSIGLNKHQALMMSVYEYLHIFKNTFLVSLFLSAIINFVIYNLTPFKNYLRLHIFGLETFLLLGFIVMIMIGIIFLEQAFMNKLLKDKLTVIRSMNE